MVRWARRSAWTVVKTSVVATSAITRALVNNRIFWVSPMSRASVLLLGGGVVLAVLVLVGLPPIGRRIQAEARRHLALGRHHHVRGDLPAPLVPGGERAASGRDALDAEAAVGAGLHEEGVLSHGDEGAHLRVDVAVDARDPGDLEGPRAGLGALVEGEIEAVVARDREHVV